MVNAPASPSEVTLPEDGPGGSGGSPRLRGLWEACLEGLQPHLGFCRALLAEISCGPELLVRGAEQAAVARGAAWRFPGRAAWFCQTSSCLPLPALSSLGPR